MTDLTNETKEPVSIGSELNVGLGICASCYNNRSTWSKELTEQGYIGCAIGYDNIINLEDIQAEIVATGWIMLCHPTNHQIITKHTKSCKHFTANV